MIKVNTTSGTLASLKSKRLLFLIPLLVIALYSNAQDTIIFKQKIARYDIGIRNAMKLSNSIGYVTLTKDSILFKSKTHQKEYNFSVCYCDVIAIDASLKYLTQGVIRIKTNYNKTYKLGGTYHNSELIALLEKNIQKKQQ